MDAEERRSRTVEGRVEADDAQRPRAAGRECPGHGVRPVVEHPHGGDHPIAFLDRLWTGLGPMLLVCGLGLVLALSRRSRTDLILASFVLVGGANPPAVRAG